MLCSKVFLLAVLLIANTGLSLGLVPTWDQIGGCSKICLSAALHVVLEDPALGTHNEICPPLWFALPTISQCKDFCSDPSYKATLTQCLKIQCPRWLVGEILLLSNHIICNISERQNVKFSSDGKGHWDVHWPAQLVATGEETARTNDGSAWPVVTAGAGVRRGLQAEFPAYPVADEPTAIDPAVVTPPAVSSFPNATATLSCGSITTATSMVFITITPAPSTNISATTILPSTSSCSCSTSTLTTSIFTTIAASSVPHTVADSSHISSSTRVTSLHSSTVTTTHFTTHSTTHSTATNSLLPMHTETGAAVAVGIKSKLLAFGAGGAGMFMIAML